MKLIGVLPHGADLTKDDLGFEVGAGTGSLTALLAEHAGAVFSIEIDPDFYQLARETVAGREQVRLVNFDILKNKNHLNPGVLEQLVERQHRWQCTRLNLAATLPYASS